MTIAALLNLPSGPTELMQWSFCHAASHADIVRVIFQNSGTNLSSFVLDPFNPYNGAELEAWLANHQIMHNQMDAKLGISGYDLSEVDWNDQIGLTEWIQFNFNEHLQVSTALGIG